MKMILLLVIILASLKSFAQTKTIDSLKKGLDNYKKDDMVKVGMLYYYSTYRQEEDPPILYFCFDIILLLFQLSKIQRN